MNHDYLFAFQMPNVRMFVFAGKNIITENITGTQLCNYACLQALVNNNAYMHGKAAIAISLKKLPKSIDSFHERSTR